MGCHPDSYHWEYSSQWRHMSVNASQITGNLTVLWKNCSDHQQMKRQRSILLTRFRTDPPLKVSCRIRGFIFAVCWAHFVYHHDQHRWVIPSLFSIVLYAFLEEMFTRKYYPYIWTSFSKMLLLGSLYILGLSFLFICFWLGQIIGCAHFFVTFIWLFLSSSWPRDFVLLLRGKLMVFNV